MNINFKATNTTLTPALKSFIEDKLSHLSKFLKNNDFVYVEIIVDKKHSSGLFNSVEISIDQSKIYAAARGNDIYEACDLVVPKIKEQLAKSKDKKVSLRRKATKITKR